MSRSLEDMIAAQRFIQVLTPDGEYITIAIANVIAVHIHPYNDDELVLTFKYGDRLEICGDLDDFTDRLNGERA